ncbi:AraC family transcriptional regulator [[Clostridium] hylemonae]|uniref:AraC family transcriptional regulator n=1 Tax=[Clostridium] hylemonae TaxID=89153 RepID=UPI0011069C3B|nr:AraC family transcriptional regulator [[Clostridium] hylemonae]
MEWIERLNKAVNYIEENITEELDYAQAARTACCSTYHFQRMFAFMAGVPLSEYIRRRRMTLAAADLQNKGAKVLDISLKYGYASPTAFNRAFQSIHGITPSSAKKEGAVLKSFPPISFQITIKGVEEMNYRIEAKESFRIIGISEPLHKDIEENFSVVPGLWQKAAADGTIGALAKMMNGRPMGLLGISACHDEDEWRYYLAVSSDMELTGSLEEYHVPAATWAIFTGSGTNRSIQELEQRIVTEWLPGSGYEYADAPDIEVYLNADPDNAQYEVWIPVRQKD